VQEGVDFAILAAIIELKVSFEEEESKLHFSLRR